MEKKELCTFLSKAEINVHMGFLSRMGRRQLRQQRIYSCSGHHNGLAFLSQRSHQLLVRRTQKNLFMAIICSSTSGMAYDLYLTGSLHHSRTFYPPLQCFPALLHSVGGLCNHNPTSTDKGGYFLCVLSLLERLYSEWRRHLKQERNRRASCLGAGTVFCKS